MLEELLMQRSMYKALVTKSSRTLSCLIKEGDINLIQKHGVMMKAWFHSFDDVCESYLEMLTDETYITAADSYYDMVYDNYMDQLVCKHLLLLREYCPCHPLSKSKMISATSLLKSAHISKTLNLQIELRTQNSEILFNIILCYCSLGYIRYKRKVDNAVDM